MDAAVGDLPGVRAVRVVTVSLPSGKLQRNEVRAGLLRGDLTR